MPEIINWSYSVRARSGPQSNATGDLSVDAYEKISLAIVAGAEIEVTVAPGTWSTVSGLFVSASKFSEDLSMSLDATKALKLDGPLVLIGAGAVSLLGDQDATLTFKNDSPEDLVVNLLVARDATP